MTDEEWERFQALERERRLRSEGWFVMLRHQNGRPILMTASLDPDDGGTTSWDAAIFATKKEAQEAGRANPIGRACGFEVFKW